MNKLLLLIATFHALLSAALPVKKLNITDSVQHHQTRFTQGLFWEQDTLWESTGIKGHSKIYKMDKKGHTLDSLKLPPNYFGEGTAKIGNRILYLTWQNNTGFILETNPLRIAGTFNILGEGWGLTVWRGEWLMSNGTEELYTLSLSNMQRTKKISITAEGAPIKLLNELEAVGDTLYANIWQRDSIAVISLPAGNVIYFLDLSALAQKERMSNPKADVLNGIAHDGKHLWITGKNWRQIYKLSR